MLVQFKNSKFEVMPNPDGSGVVWVYNFRVANKLNRLLGVYVDYKFKEGDEAIFKISQDRVVAVKKILGLR